MTIIFSLLIVFVALFILVRYLENTAVFFPGKNVSLKPSQLGLPYEDLYLKTSDNVRINAWFLKNPKAKSTILFAHGNAGAMSDRLMRTKFFYDLGLNVLVFDYRGYGNSSGKPTEQGVYLDAQAAYDYLKTRKDVDMNHVIAYGSSLGGVVAVDLATKRPVTVLILDSAFTSARDVARLFYPYLPRFMIRLKLDAVGKIRYLIMPKLIIHSPDDRVIPYFMGQRLFAVAAEPKEFIISSGGHNEIQIISDHKTGNAFRQYLISKELL